MEASARGVLEAGAGEDADLTRSTVVGASGHPLRASNAGMNMENETQNLSFGQALEALKQGKRVQRSGWNGKGMWLSLQVPDSNSKMTLPYIYIEYPPGHPAYPNGSRVPWLASQTDMLSNDWRVL